MEQKNFEQNIRSAFDGYQPKVDDQMIWNSIEDQLPKKESRKFFFWILLGVGLLLSGSIAFFSLTNSSKTSLPEAPSIANETDIISESPDIQTSELTNEQKDQKIESQNTNTISASQSNNETISTNEQLSLKTNELHSSPLSNNEGGSLSTTFNSFESKQTLSSRHELKTQQSMFSPSYIEVDKKNNITFLATLDKINSSELSPLDWKKNQLALIIPVVDLLPISIHQSETNPSSFLLQAGVYLPSIKYNTIASGNELRDLRKASEKGLEMIQVSGLFKKSIANRLSLLTGIQFSTTHRQSTHTVCDEESVDIAFQSVTRVTKTTHSRINTDYNLSIPLKIEYKYVQGPKLSASLIAGYEHSVWGKYNGYEIELDKIEYAIDTDADARYKNKGANYLSIAPSIQYRLTEKINLSTNFEYKYGVNSMNTTASIVERSYDFFGIDFGLHYYINK